MCNLLGSAPPGGDGEAAPPTEDAAEAAAPAAPTALGVAAALVEQSHRFREAVASRSEVLSAVERFYLDTLECQWHLEALDTMLAAVSISVGETPFLDEEYLRATGGEPEPSPEDRQIAEEDWRKDAVRRCLLEIDAQQQGATEALKERADVYSAGVLASTGLIERLATGDGERERASARLTRLVANIFSEIICEARELTVVSSMPDVLPKFTPILQRRQVFWQQQLEEMWSAWESATIGMHDFGHDVVSAWIELSDAVRAGKACCRGGDSTGQRTLLLNALAEAAGQSLEVELLNSQGLAGLDDEAVHAIATAVGAEGQARPLRLVNGWAADSCCSLADLDVQEWSAVRLSMLRSVMRLLEKSGVLCEAELRTSPSFLQLPAACH